MFPTIRRLQRGIKMLDIALYFLVLTKSKLDPFIQFAGSSKGNLRQHLSDDVLKLVC